MTTGPRTDLERDRAGSATRLELLAGDLGRGSNGILGAVSTCSAGARITGAGRTGASRRRKANYSSDSMDLQAPPKPTTADAEGVGSRITLDGKRGAAEPTGEVRSGEATTMQYRSQAECRDPASTQTKKEIEPTQSMHGI